MRKFAFLISILFILMLACNLPGRSTPPSGQVSPTTPASDGSVAITQPASGDGSTQVADATTVPSPTPTPTLTPTPTPIPSIPVSIQEGLASLNSYSLIIETTSYTTTITDQTSSRIEFNYSQELDAQFTHYVLTVPVEGEEPSQVDSYVYSIGNDQCSGNDADGWEYVSYTAQEKEMQDILIGMADLIPLIDDPVYVESVEINGVMTNHFTFQISGVGAASGVDVTANQGEYWLAQDGQYIIRYSLVLETIDPNTQTLLHTEFFIDLTTINQPIPIAYPAGCTP
jgi:hypothetical protein